MCQNLSSEPDVDLKLVLIECLFSIMAVIKASFKPIKVKNRGGCRGKSFTSTAEAVEMYIEMIWKCITGVYSSEAKVEQSSLCISVSSYALF